MMIFLYVLLMEIVFGIVYAYPWQDVCRIFLCDTVDNSIRIVEFLVYTIFLYMIIYANFNVVNRVQGMYHYIYLRKREDVGLFLIQKIIIVNVYLILQKVLAEVLFLWIFKGMVPDVGYMHQNIRLLLMMLFIGGGGILFFYYNIRINRIAGLSCIMILLFNIFRIEGFAILAVILPVQICGDLWVDFLCRFFGLFAMWVYIFLKTKNWKGVFYD